MLLLAVVLLLSSPPSLSSSPRIPLPASFVPFAYLFPPCFCSPLKSFPDCHVANTDQKQITAHTTFLIFLCKTCLRWVISPLMFATPGRGELYVPKAEGGGMPDKQTWRLMHVLLVLLMYAGGFCANFAYLKGFHNIKMRLSLLCSFPCKSGRNYNWSWAKNVIKALSAG